MAPHIRLPEAILSNDRTNDAAFRGNNCEKEYSCMWDAGVCVWPCVQKHWTHQKGIIIVFGSRAQNKKEICCLWFQYIKSQTSETLFSFPFLLHITSILFMFFNSDKEKGASRPPSTKTEEVFSGNYPHTMKTSNDTNNSLFDHYRTRL